MTSNSKKAPPSHIQKKHLESQIHWNKELGVQTRRKLLDSFNQRHYVLFSQIEPKNFNEAREYQIG